MKQEDKQLLLVDLSARLPYGVKGKVYAEVSDGKYDISGDIIFYDAPFDVILDGINISTEEIHVVAIGNEDTVDFIEEQQTDGKPYTIDEFKPYLRPMSSMTEEEVDEFTQFDIYANGEYIMPNYEAIDWLNAHHFDYRGLIDKGLALKATKELYKC